MSCTQCRHARKIIFHKLEETLMLLFTGDNEAERKAIYLANVNGTYASYAAGELPYNWFGFVLTKTCEEYNAYFPDAKPLREYIAPEILEAYAAYSFDEAHGSLFAVLVDKFKNG